MPIWILWGYIILFPYSYMDGEFSMYRWQRDVRLGAVEIGEEEADVIVLGDSRAKSGVIPWEISESALNLAEGGSTSIETYYTLKDYIQNNEKPKTVILIIAPYHFVNVDGFWDRSVYFDFLSFNQAKEVLDLAEEYNELETFFSPNNEKGLLTLIEYKIKVPYRYISAIKKSLFNSRQEFNETRYQLMSETGGYTLFREWFSKTTGPYSIETEMEDFNYSKVLDEYYRKTIELCIENDIEIICEQIPFTENSNNEIDSLKIPFEEYLSEVAKEYPQAYVVTSVDSYPDIYFTDSNHLTLYGAGEYTSYLMEKYENIFNK